MTATARPHDRRRAARHRAGDVRALRADPRLVGRPWRRSGHVARDPRARPAPARGALAGDGELADRARRSGDAIAQHGFQHLRHTRAHGRALPIAAQPQRRPRVRVRRTRRAGDPPRGGRRKARAEARRDRAARLRRARLRLHAGPATARSASASTGGRRCWAAPSLRLGATASRACTERRGAAQTAGRACRARAGCGTRYPPRCCVPARSCRGDVAPGPAPLRPRASRPHDARWSGCSALGPAVGAAAITYNELAASL